MPKLFSRHEGPQEIAITISARTIVKIFAIIVGTTLLFAALHHATHALILIFTAVFLALALNAPVSWVAHHLPGNFKGSRGLATGVAALLVILVLSAFIASLAPPIARQTKTLLNQAPQIVRDVRDSNSDLGKFVKRYHLEKQVDKFSKQLSARLQNASGSAVSTVGSITSSVFSVLTILVFTVMMLSEGPSWLEFAKQVLPKHKRAKAERLSRDMYKVVKGYVNGQVLLAAIASIMLLPGLLIFNVSYPIALLAVVFICGLIPMVGHTIGAGIVTLVALFTSPLAALGILIYYITYQQIENYLIQPKLQANATNMSPLLVFMSVIVGVSFSGLLGGLVAIPIAGCIRVAVLDYLQSRDIIETPATDSAT